MKNENKMFAISLLIVANMVLLSLLIVEEYKSHTLGYILERKGLYEIKETERTDYWAVRGWWNTLNKMDLHCDAVFFGNSITHGSDFQKVFPNKNIVNIGYCGNNLVDMKYRINQVIACHPKKLFIMAGTNDLSKTSINVYKKRYIELLLILRDSLPNTQFYIESVLPTNHKMKSYAPEEKVKSANNEMKIVAKDFNAIYIDLYSLYEKNGELPKNLTKDGVHLKHDAYKIWEKEISKYLE